MGTRGPVRLMQLRQEVVSAGVLRASSDSGFGMSVSGRV